MNQLCSSGLVNGRVVEDVEKRLAVRREARVPPARRREPVLLRQVEHTQDALGVAISRRTGFTKPAVEDALQVDARTEITRPVQWGGRKRLHAGAHFVAKIRSDLE